MGGKQLVELVGAFSGSCSPDLRICPERRIHFTSGVCLLSELEQFLTPLFVPDNRVGDLGSKVALLFDCRRVLSRQVVLRILVNRSRFFGPQVAFRADCLCELASALSRNA